MMRDNFGREHGKYPPLPPRITFERFKELFLGRKLTRQYPDEGGEKFVLVVDQLNGRIVKALPRTEGMNIFMYDVIRVSFLDGTHHGYLDESEYYLMKKDLPFNSLDELF